MTRPLIYLAGGISGCSYDEATEWRNTATKYLNQYGIETLDPMRDKSREQWDEGGLNHDYPGMSPKDIFDRDIADIDRCDALLVNLKTAKSIGTPFEMGYAYAKGKPLYILTPGVLFDHPFVRTPATDTCGNYYALLREIVKSWGNQS